MRNPTLIFSLITAVTFFTSCSPYGDKVEVNAKSEVYYKDGATKEEAKRVGDFLLRNNYFDDQTEKSIQILRSKDTAIVKFVVNEEKLKGNAEFELGFQYVQLLLKDSVFGGKPTKVILANEEFDDIRTIQELPGSSQRAGETKGGQ